MTIARDSTVKQIMPIADRVQVEGYVQSVQGTLGPLTFTTDGSVQLEVAVPGITRAFYVESIVISATKFSRLQLQWSESGFDASRTQIVGAIVSPGQPVVVPVRAIFRPSVLPQTGQAKVTLRVREVYDTDKTNMVVAAAANGFSITDDFDYAAPKTILWLGDSITAGGTGPSKKENQYDWRLRKYYRDKSIHARLVQMSLSGSTSDQIGTRLSKGYYDPIPADLFVYSVGANDGGQGVSAATYRANLDAAIAWKKTQRPRAKMIVFGPTPNENNTTETNLVAIRAQAAAAVTAAADPLIKFCDLGSAYDRLAAGNYASTDTAGTRVHPSDAGHAAIWSVVAPFLDAQVPVI